jgi:putative ABC transport system substrate-binding protein
LSIVVVFLASSSAGCFADGVSAVLSADIAPYRQAFDGFKEIVHAGPGRLRTIEHILGKEDGERIAQQIAMENPQLVFAVGPEASKLAGTRSAAIPAVLSMVLDPRAFAAANVTWVALEIPAGMKLERIKRILPKARRVGVVYSLETAAGYRDLARAATALGLSVVGREVESGKELPAAFRDLAARIDLFLMLADTRIFFSDSIEYLLTEALRSGVPVVGLAASYTRAGALCSFEADYPDVGRQAGELALRIIAGETPPHIAPPSPRRINISLNLAVAERLGLRIDPAVIEEASNVYQ